MLETDPKSQYSRRQALLAAGTGLVATVAGCSYLAGSPTSTGTPSETTVPPTTGESTPGLHVASDRLRAQLAAVEAATSRYADVTAARDDGYVVLGPSMAGMGWHVLDQQGVEQAAKRGPSRTDPPLLTYLRTGDGLSLGAVEYAVPREAAPSTPDLFADGDAAVPEEWSVHRAATHVFATPSDGRRDPAQLDPDTVLTDDYWAEFRPADPHLAPGDTVSLNWGTTRGKSGDRTPRVVDAIITHPSLRTLHVWLHQHNPAGVFAETNPRFGGDGSGHHHGGHERGHHENGHHDDYERGHHGG